MLFFSSFFCPCIQFDWMTSDTVPLKMFKVPAVLTYQFALFVSQKGHGFRYVKSRRHKKGFFPTTGFVRYVRTLSGRKCLKLFLFSCITSVLKRNICSHNWSSCVCSQSAFLIYFKSVKREMCAFVFTAIIQTQHLI